jgi:hypothetical protein
MKTRVAQTRVVQVNDLREAVLRTNSDVDLLSVENAELERGHRENRNLRHTLRKTVVGHHLETMGILSRSTSRETPRISSSLEVIASARGQGLLVQGATPTNKHKPQSFAQHQVLQHNKKWYIISSTGYIATMWEASTLSLLVFVVIYLPYATAFLDDATTPVELQNLYNTASIFFMLDVLLNFLTTHENDRGEILYEPAKIRRQYYHTWFWLDVCAGLPLTFVFPDVKYLGYFKCLRLLRVESQMRQLMPKLQHTNVINIMGLICGFSLIAHWLGCFWYIVVDDARNYNVEWDAEVASSRLLKALNATLLVDADFQSWLETHLIHTNEVNKEHYYRWLVSLYSATLMLLGENLEPVEGEEFIVHTVATMVGAILQAYIFGQVALLIADQNSTSVKWRQKMVDVSGKMRALHLPKDLQARVRNYYSYFWSQHRGINHTVMFGDLSGPLLSEISLCLHR